MKIGDGLSDSDSAAGMSAPTRVSKLWTADKVGMGGRICFKEWNSSIDKQDRAAGYDEVIKTTDGGLSWTDLSPIGVKDWLRGMDFVDYNNGWILSTDAGILHHSGPVPPPLPPPEIPDVYALSAFPNPFNPNTSIQFSVKATQRVELKIYDITGRLVQTLADQVLNSGDYRIPFDGSALPSGIYFAACGANISKTIKLVMVK